MPPGTNTIHNLSTSALPSRRVGPCEKREMETVTYKSAIVWEEPEKWVRIMHLGLIKADQGGWGCKGKNPKFMHKGPPRPPIRTCASQSASLHPEAGPGISKRKHRLEKPCAQGLVLSSCWELSGHHPMGEPELCLGGWETMGREAPAIQLIPAVSAEAQVGEWGHIGDSQPQSSLSEESCPTQPRVMRHNTYLLL